MKINWITKGLSGVVLLGLIAFSYSSRAQEPQCYVVLDSKNQEPVPYALIRSGSLDIFADENGSFCTSSNLNEIFSLTRIGYEPTTWSRLGSGDTIYMDRGINLIQEVTVQASSKIYELGYHRSKTIGTAAVGDGSAKAVLIKGDQSNARIISIIVSTRRNRKGISLRASLFAVGEDGKPSDLIYSQLARSSSGRDLIQFDLNDEVVLLPESGIFVACSFQTDDLNMGSTSKQVVFKLTHDLKEKQSYFSSHGRWFELDSSELPISNFKMGLKLQKD